MINWIYKLIGKEVADKIGLEDKVADETTSKSWYKSKSIWAAIITVVLGAVEPISQAFGHPVTIPTWLIQVLIGMGIYTSRTATTDIK